MIKYTVMDFEDVKELQRFYVKKDGEKYNYEHIKIPIIEGYEITFGQGECDFPERYKQIYNAIKILDLSRPFIWERYEYVYINDKTEVTVYHNREDKTE